jgi:hypothetical protein
MTTNIFIQIAGGIKGESPAIRPNPAAKRLLFPTGSKKNLTRGESKIAGK